MCGIAGISLNKNDTDLDTSMAAAYLLRGIASRGPDATGAAWYEPESEAVALTKVPVPAWRFIEARKERMHKASPTMLLHTRFATHGSVEERVNNHPIQHGDIIGVHNGVLSNDNEIFQDLDVERNGEVDSEAIFALVNVAKDITAAFGALEGDAAVAWIDTKDPETLHLAKVVGRPLYVAQTEGGSLLFASTAGAVDQTLSGMKLKKVWGEEMRDGHYMRVVGGRIMDYLPLTGLRKADEEWTKKFSYTSGEDNRTSENKDTATVIPDASDETPMWQDLDDDTSDDLVASGQIGNKPREAYTPQAITYLEQYMFKKSDEELEALAGGGSQFAKDELERRANLTPVFSAPTPKEVFESTTRRKVLALTQ